ncbi:hypothetical protein PVAG01_07594 [Phlyctema vagabunda]|uniref:Mg2+ transporter protein, CorA-like/Zinc transport protein ZntB n=1 Tax=Phlyctema vagabunda TaxID=108571 RepID=A0ABR4PCV1_9HELO
MHTWIFISPSSKMERKVNKFIEHISASEIDGQINPLELHLVLIQAVLANWRWYIKSLVDRATEQSSRIIAATAGRGNSGSIDIEINFADRQVLKVVEDRVLDLITIFESTADTISTILERYGLIYNTSNNQPWHDQVTINLKDNLREVELYRKKADTLHKMVQGTASLLSDLLDYENAKTAEENSKALAVLAQESREENITMRKLTEEGTKDAAAVKVITLITILFLPTTVVSGFFSTQFVKQSDDGRLLELTDNWWLIVAVALPLTGFTILVWYCWMKYPWKRWWCQLWNGWRPSRPPGGTESEKPNSETSEPTHLYHRSEDNFSVGSQLELGVQGSFDEIRYKHSRRREIRDKDPG